ncbi:16969_t:CDS:2, partial [Dentiscutata erythropus]
FCESTYDLESDKLIYNLEFNRPTCNSVIVVQKNKDIRLKEKLYEGIIFQSWEEAFDTLELYSQYEEFKLRKERIEKTSSRSIHNDYNHELSLCRTKFFNDSKLTKEMYKRVEFYMNTVKLKPLQIQRTLWKEFFDHEVYLSEIYKATVLCQTKQATGGYVPAIIMTDINLALDLAISEDLLELAEALEANIEEEIKKAKYAYWKTRIPLMSSATTLSQILFSELDKALSRFIMSEIQKIQHAEIKSCLNYHASAVTKDEMIKYQVMMLYSHIAVFHITYIHKRWYKDIYSDLQEEPYYVTICFSKNRSQDQPTEFTRQDVLEKPQNLLTEIQEEELVNSLANDSNEDVCSNSLDDNEECEETNSLVNIPLQYSKKRKTKERLKSSK